MASQPCTKCGIDVDPDIQDSCPNCGRHIEGASTAVGWLASERSDDPPVWSPSDTEQYESIPSEPQGSGTRRWLGGFGVRIALGLLIFGGISAWTAITSAERDDSGAIAEEGDIAAVDLAVGDCVLDPGEGFFDEVRAVACSDPHDFEIYHIATLTGGSYPTNAQFDRAAEQHCLPAFDAYTGERYENSDLWIGYFLPDEGGWSDGDRTLQCYLYLPDASLTGSRASG